MKSTMRFQYELVLDERNVLLNYCSTIGTADFTMVNPIFGNGGSIKSLLVHICNTYCGWLSELVGEKYASRNHHEMKDLNSCRQYFEYTNNIVHRFIEQYENRPLQMVKVNHNGKMLDVTPLELFTHTITHEFHHKGQILSLSRSLGYIPVDTDIMR